MANMLRTNAEERLQGGTAPVTRGPPPGTQALTLLHRLASAPESASDALKLLHELQVHQVELDLLLEQAEQDRLELAENLKRYTKRFDLAPFAYLALDAEGRVVAANRIATDWLATGKGEAEAWGGRPVEELLAPESRLAIRGLLAGLRQGDGHRSCAVQCGSGGSSAQAVAAVSPDDGQVLLALIPMPG